MSPGPAAAAPETPFVRFKGLAYRGHDPSWAHAPLSGEGAAAQGGRFNPKGVAALYLSLAVETVFKEVSAGFGHRFDPLTICAYDVECEALVDLTTEDARASATTAPASCSRSTPMICSSVNLLRFISGPSPVVRIPAARGGETRGHVTGRARPALPLSPLPAALLGQNPA
ncbi:hypothetical protein CNY89_14475, partial [Amaricoccus sp. HAR-UPW-R2A-40]